MDEALTLRCPRCSAAFAEFDGCFALHCSNNTCRCGFCAWCLKDCGTDAHPHVRHCVENASQRGDYDSFFSTTEEFRKHHNKKRVTKVQALLKEADLNKNATEKLRELMKKDLEDLKIELVDVFPRDVVATASASQTNFFGMKWPAAGYRKV